MKTPTMTADQFRLALEALGFRGRYWAPNAAEALGSDERTIRRWMAGERAVPGPVVRLIEALQLNQGLTIDGPQDLVP